MSDRMQPLIERYQRIAEMSEDQLNRLELMIGSVQESVGIEHIVDCILDETSSKGDGVIRAYVGFEPSGKAHIGWKVISLQLKRLLEARVNVLVFLADWHAWVNDKFAGSMEAIQTTGKYMEDTFRALLDSPPEGDGPGELRFLYASDIMDSGAYWARVLRCSKNVSLSRVRRTFSIMGRDEASSDGDLSRFYYPAMQAADIFELDIDLAIGGMDQRKAHMYMRDVADRWNWQKATCLHTSILSNLRSKGARMESFDHKMSKSNPNGAVLLHDDASALKKKLRKAYLDPQDSESPVFELIEHVILPELSKLDVTPNPEYGEPSTWHDLNEIKQALHAEKLHPFDVKMAVADALSLCLSSISEYFNHHPESLDLVNQLMR